jgi:transcriptional regulator with XRE-family HTH domain
MAVFNSKNEAKYEEIQKAFECEPQGGALHRIRAIRLREGMSLVQLAREMGTDVHTLRSQEDGNTDLKLSDLRKWSKAMNVPVDELLADNNDDTVSPPLLKRAKMIRIMKTVQSIREDSSSVRIKRLADMLFDHLTEIMPELATVNAWHSVGRRRRADELGAVHEKRIPYDALGYMFDDEEGL